jgi:hypothetical protein
MDSEISMIPIELKISIHSRVGRNLGSEIREFAPYENCTFGSAFKRPAIAAGRVLTESERHDFSVLKDVVDCAPYKGLKSGRKHNAEAP